MKEEFKKVESELATKLDQKVVDSKVVSWLRGRYASLSIGLISLAESFIVPIIIDPFLIAYILADREKWFRFTVFAIVGSVLGGLLSYLLGFFFYDTIGKSLLAFYGLEESFSSISDQLDANGFVFVLIGALTPIPYKVVAIAGGFMHLNIFTFLAASIVGRLLRLGVVGSLTYAVGPHIVPILRRNVMIFVYTLTIILVSYIIWRMF